MRNKRALPQIIASSTVWRTDIGIMNALAEMRQFLNTNKDIYVKLINMDSRILEHDLRIDSYHM
jgi:hypothetical protein